jgi:hypothetical protein
MKQKKKTETAKLISARIFLDDLRNICSLLEGEGLAYKVELDEYELDSEDIQSSDLTLPMQPYYSLSIDASENHENIFRFSINDFGTRFYYHETIKNTGIYHAVRRIINRRTRLWDYVYAYRIFIPFILIILSLIIENKIIKLSLVILQVLSSILITFYYKNKKIFIPKISTERNDFFSKNKDELLTQFLSQLGVLLIGIIFGILIK